MDISLALLALELIDPHLQPLVSRNGVASEMPLSRREVEMWPKVSLPLLLLFLAYKQWDKHRQIHTLVSKLRSSGVL